VEETLPGGEGGVEDEAHPRGRGRRVSGTRGEATTGARRFERAIRHGHAMGDGRRRDERRTREREGGREGHERLRKREKKRHHQSPSPGARPPSASRIRTFSRHERFVVPSDATRTTRAPTIRRPWTPSPRPSPSTTRRAARVASPTSVRFLDLISRACARGHAPRRVRSARARRI
jgi:hypothetical protein